MHHSSVRTPSLSQHKRLSKVRLPVSFRIISISYLLQAVNHPVFAQKPERILIPRCVVEVSEWMGGVVLLSNNLTAPQ